MNRIDITSEALAHSHLLPGQRVFIVADERGESELYEAYSLECVSPNERGDLEHAWTEGIRKDRTTMYPAWLEAIQPALTSMKKRANP